MKQFHRPPQLPGRRAFAGGLLAAAGLATGVGRAAAQPGPVTGKVEISQVQVAFLFSGNLGSGTLNFQGRSWRFSIGGLGAGGIGVSRMDAYGDVYNLYRIDDFPGVYFSARYGIALGQQGGGELFLQNSQNVGMRLRARREGLALSLGADGIQISLR